MALRSLGLVACALILAGPVSAVAAGSAGVPPIVERAALANAEATQGVLVHERHIHISVSAGPAHFSQDNDAMMLMVDGSYSCVRYTRVVENGKTLSSEALTKRDEQNNQDLERGAGFFKQPYDQRYLADYTYEDEGLSNGEAAVKFQSVVRDSQHGDGVMRIEIASGRVDALQYTPDVFPYHASAGTTIESFAEPVPGVWTIVRIDREYSGHIAFFGGKGTVSEVLDHFNKLPSAAAGLAFLRASVK